jgi:hypothetical protein
MKRLLFSVLFFFVFTGNIFSQDTIKASPKVDLSKIAMASQSDSYVTLPFDIGNLEPLIFEANISPSFVIRERKDSRLMGMLTAQIIIRMYNEESLPVRTPSYMPQISVYYLLGDKYADKKNTIFGKLAHHSNGQDGDFYDENGDINLKSGNFSTNFIELGYIHTSYSKKLNAVKFFKTSLEMHPQSWMFEEIRGMYSGLRWHNTFSAFKIPVGNTDTEKRAQISLKLETMIMMDDINEWSTFEPDRFNASLTFYYHPKFLEEIGFFVQYYHGMDYYNIYFMHQIDVVRFGIMTDILRF